MNIEQEKAKKILKALIYQNIIEESNKENRGEELNYDRPLIKEFLKFCGLSDDDLDDWYEEAFENIDEFENNSFWDDFAEKVAIVKREEEAEKKNIKLSKDEAFIMLCRYMDKINDNLQDVDQIDLWKYIAKYFKTKSMMETNGQNDYQLDKEV